MKLSQASAGCSGTIQSLSGSHHLLSRLIGIGIVEGSTIQVIQNKKGQPVLFYCRDSVIALSRSDCEKIELTKEEPINE